MKNENINNSKDLNINEKKNPIFSNDDKNNNEKQKNSNLLMFEKLLNDKNKFKLDNHFDTINCEKFLSEKEKYLSEIKFVEDEDYLNKEELEKIISKKDIIIPNNAPNKYTFGQY